MLHPALRLRVRMQRHVRCCTVQVQYKVFSQFGLNDTQIRNWFNGPAFLTWSRGQASTATRGMACIAPCCALHGQCRVWHVAYWQRRMRAVWRCRVQNEYGAKIAGPLPRSFMRSQWALQKQILQRSRALGMSAQLPGAP